jgi:molybdate transport system substrate-binding protein
MGGVMRLVPLFVLLAATSTPQPAREGPVLRVWTARAIATVLAEVGPEFERATGYRLDVTSDLASGFDRRLAAGERTDLVISGSSNLDAWLQQGRLDPDTRTELARSGIGVAVRAGAPKPDIRSVEAFKRTLLTVRSVAYLRVGSGVHVDRVMERLGIAEAVRAKAIRPDTDIVSELVARGEVDLGIVVITQILTTPGVALAGPLPAEVQSHVAFVAAVSRTATHPDAARQLIRFLSRPTAKDVMRRQGMQPRS